MARIAGLASSFPCFWILVLLPTSASCGPLLLRKSLLLQSLSFASCACQNCCADSSDVYFLAQMAGLAFGHSVLPQGDYSVLPLKEGICRHQMIFECGTNLIVFQNLLLTTHNGQLQISISTLRYAFHHCIMSIYSQNTKTQIYLFLNKSPLQMLLNEAC